MARPKIVVRFLVMDGETIMWIDVLSRGSLADDVTHLRSGNNRRRGKKANSYQLKA
jgi:hypothetical protein